MSAKLLLISGSSRVEPHSLCYPSSGTGLVVMDDGPFVTNVKIGTQIVQLFSKSRILFVHLVRLIPCYHRVRGREESSTLSVYFVGPLAANGCSEKMRCSKPAKCRCQNQLGFYDDEKTKSHHQPCSSSNRATVCATLRNIIESGLFGKDPLHHISDIPLYERAIYDSATYSDSHDLNVELS